MGLDRFPGPQPTAVIDATQAPYNCNAAAADNAAGLNAAMTAAAVAGANVFLPAGNFQIQSPVLFKAGLVGVSPQATRLKAHSSFVGGYLLDFNGGAEFKQIRNIKLDMTYRPGVAAMGSSGDAEGSANTLWDTVYFVQSHASTYPVGGDSVGSVMGMTTGSTFLHCRWENCPLWANIGVNQDDVTFIGCRFGQTVGGAGGLATNAPLVLAGQNVTMLDTYMFVIPTAASGADKPIIKIGSSPVSIRGFFIECETGSNYTHLFYQVNPSVSFRAETIRWGCVDGYMASLVAVCRANLTPTTGNGASDITINDLSLRGDIATLFDIVATATTSGQRLNLKFGGCDKVGALAAFTAGSTSSASTVTLDGVFKGKRYDHMIQPNRGVGYMYPIPPINNGQYELTASSAASTTGGSVTFTLPDEGVWLTHVLAAVDGHYSYGMSGTYLITSFRSSIGNYIQTTELLGTVHTTGQSEPTGVNTLTVSNPSIGVVTVSVVWPGAVSRTCGFVMSLTKIGTRGYFTN